MQPTSIDQSQRKAAKVVGFVYLFAMATSIFAEVYLRGSLMVAGDVAATAQNIIAHQQHFRLGIATELVTYVADIALISALYVILAPVNRHLALLATLLRLSAETVFVMRAANSLEVLRILSGADYLRVFQPDQLAALARVSLGGHAAANGAGLVFLGLGSTVFGYLWLRSGYVPRPLAVLGVFASALLAAGLLAIIIFPSLGRMLYPVMIPMFFFEVGMGFWLLVKGLRPAEALPT